jgi:uncharacterized membrane protein
MAPSPQRIPRFEAKRAFLRGLGVLLPSVLTLWILVAAYQFVDRNIAAPINGLARSALASASTMPGPLLGRFDPSPDEVDARLAEYAAAHRRLPERERLVAELRAAEVASWWSERWYTQLFGLVVALIGVYLVGRLVGGWLGRALLGWLERLLGGVPIVRAIYPSVKQIVGFFFADSAGGSSASMKFSRVVLVQYPREGIWSMGLLTGTAMRSIERESGESLTVFIPSSPTPFTGYTITVPRTAVHELPITIDEALKYLVSAGVVVPPREEGPPRDPLPPSRPREAVPA